MGAGISRLEQVGCAVLERTGHVSVPRRGTALDPWLLADIAGSQRLAGSLERVTHRARVRES